MNYLKAYVKLVRKAERRGLLDGVYTERHHVFPQSVFGQNSRIVILSGREHFVAHMMLFLGCRQRYGDHHFKTRKMAFAACQMGWRVGQRSYSKNIHLAREFAAASNRGDNNPAKRYEVRAKISEAKRGCKRPDMLGKKYFGADEDSYLQGIEKMRRKKTGMKIDYPQNRLSPPCSEEKKLKISESRQSTKDRFMQMSDTEFQDWLSHQDLYGPSGRRNANVTRVLLWRGKNIEEFYNE